uniref:transposase n=1 Tax=Rickettsia endosymbiont of Urophora cardui TaxID=3066265 RepID=UPI00313F34DC
MVIFNHKAEIIAVKITKANRADLSVLESITQKITGKVFGDKAYICKELWFKLYSRNLRMITNIRKDMKNYLLELEDKAMLRKRSLIESVFNILKNRMNLEHTRHRSPVNFLVHILACVTSYAITNLNSGLI